MSAVSARAAPIDCSRLAGIAQGADEPVMRLDVRWVGGDGSAKRLDGFGGMPAASRSRPCCESDSAVGVSGAVTAVIRIRVGEPVQERVAVMEALVKSHTEYLVFETKKRREMVHITDQVEQIVRRSGVKDGLCFVSPMHITAAVYVNDLESGLIEDIGKWLEELAPARPDYKHHQTGEDNGDAHLKSLLLHHETTLPVTEGRLDLGTWQRVFYAEFDGQRRKRVIVKVLGVE